MTIPVWVLLAFAAWTLLILAATVGVYRWTSILTGRVPIRQYAEYKIEGADWYKRAMRAHANCVENLPVFGAIVLVLVVTGADTRTLDILALVVIIARVFHTLVHVSFEQTNKVTFCRSMFFNVQWISMIIMAILAARHAA